MRVAVVGGGASGLSAALHLAPLVAAGKISGPIDVFDNHPEGSNTGKEVGVGIWSTALDHFSKSKEPSHQIAYQEMVQHGSFVRGVGYRTPKGVWLAQSRLEGEIPSLLFLREKDMMAALRKAVHAEEEKGTIAMHSDRRVESIFEDSLEPWSAPIVLQDASGNLSTTEKDYHLIVAADGMNSLSGEHTEGIFAPEAHSPQVRAPWVLLLATMTVSKIGTS